MTYVYLAEDENNKTTLAALESTLKKENIQAKNIIQDTQSNRIDWKLRELGSLIKHIKKGETLFTYEAQNLARSTTQLLEIIKALAEKNANLCLVKYNRTFSAAEMIDTKMFLQFLKDAEDEYETRRQDEPFEKRTLSGVPLGRPKGRKNKSRKLDKHLPEIKKYLALKISKASIAKLIGCHAQTLYNYLDDKDLLTQEEKNAGYTENE